MADFKVIDLDRVAVKHLDDAVAQLKAQVDNGEWTKDTAKKWAAQVMMSSEVQDYVVSAASVYKVPSNVAADIICGAMRLGFFLAEAQLDENTRFQA